MAGARPGSVRRWCAAVLAGAAAFGAAGCSAAYLLRAGVEEARILWRRESIEGLLSRPGLPPERRAKLEIVLETREFAEQVLSLRVAGSYATLARVDDDQTVHVVTAAYPLRLEPYTWWFPIVGRVPYKGFFSEQAARAEASSLQAEGFDTYVRPSVAFSTLGWFDDPLLTPMLRYDRVGLANTVLHELTHSTFYLAGQARFNESFASFVGHRGAMQFFADRGDAPAREAATRAWKDALLYSDFLGRLFQRLEREYGRGIGIGERERIFDEARAELSGLPWLGASPPRFDAPGLNNAVLLHERMYADRLSLFERLFVDEGQDLRRAIARVLETAKRHPNRPFAALDDLLKAG